MTVRELRGLTIGEFGRRSGLSVKALRLYDLSGLLPPAEVDPASGYRRYAVSQLDRARRISLLRRLDMPLAVVAEVLAGNDEEAVERLDRWWAAQEQATAAKRGSIGWLRVQLAAATQPALAYEVHRRDVPATKVASIRRATDQQGLAGTIHELQWQVRDQLAGATTTAAHWVIYHGFVTPDSEATVEVCVPFTGAAEPAGTMVIRLEPAHTELYTTVVRDDCFYPRIMQAYETLARHVDAEGLVLSAPVREVYLAHWPTIAGSDPFVHVAQPVGP
ncbi:MerR family transcriptional regulator [Actinoplanes auranticolor]|uniref:MerR family transcriptional regulator n=1 Tax=Actinoplanes auranticolor TaxID=47988 RepID=A0A919S6L2_9ACTN|nr:MerR family transcriptional regulator [Actinoplanes auranticolor]GIM65252.1 MerR family transcriptional regulator [Actinoplanes auranticolor]